MSTTQPIKNPVQLQKFKNYYYKEHPNIRNYTLCVLGLNTALRITDILHLKWSDVYDFISNCFFSHISLTEQKTGKHNLIVLNQTAVSALQLYHDSLTPLPLPQNYLFQSRKGNNCPLSRSQAFRIVKEAAAFSGMQQHISCHSMRKTFGYYAWQQGISPVLLMEIYNHSSYQITKRYLGIEQEDKDKVFQSIAL